jgi:uncharacterized Zn finger protein
MARYGDYPEYVPVGEKKKRNEKSVEQMKKKNPSIAPVTLVGRKLTRTWWGKSWNDNLERYADYANRIARGRSYVRHGAVLDLQIVQGQIQALVQGSSSKPYKIQIAIQPLTSVVWDAMIKDCAGKIASLQELMAGKFPNALSEMFTAKGNGLFPSPKEITLGCSCPDSARMCKHVAAALYGVGVRLDDDPASFFTLRNVKVEELISETLVIKSQSMLDKSKSKGRRVIDNEDLSDVFGIEINN